MSTFPDWGEVAKDALVLPIHGTKYTIPPLGYLDEIKIRSAQDETRRVVDDEDAAEPPVTLTDEEFLRMVLGGALKQMRDNNVPPTAIAHAATVAHTDATLGRETALYVWERGLDPKALAEDMATIRKAVDAASSPAKKTPARKTAARKSAARKRTRSTT